MDEEGSEDILNAIVMGILDALIGFFMRALASFLQFFADTFLESVEWNFETFGDYIPFFANVLSFFKVFAAGWLVTVGLLFVLKCFGLAAGLQINRSKIWQFVLRYLFFGYLAVHGWGIMSFFYLELVNVIDEVMVIDATQGGGFVNGLLEIGSRVGEGTLLAAAGASGAIIGVAKVLVLFVITVMLVVNFFKLIALFFLRYIRLVFLVALAPVAFGMAILEETKQIFDTYIRTFFADMFVFIMTVFLIKGFISVLYSAGTFKFDDFDGLFADNAYKDLVWAFFALAYSNFAVQFDQFIGSLGVNISRGGGTGGSVIGAIGTSAMLLRRAIGPSRSGAGIGTPMGDMLSRNWNNIKSATLGGARAGFAQGTTKGGAFAMGAVGAAKGFASTTNVAKAAEMTKDGSSFAETLNQRFADMQAAAGKNMSQKDYDATKKRAEENGLDVDQQRMRDSIMGDMKAGNITPDMAQSKLAAHGLLRDDELDATSSMSAGAGAAYTQPQSNRDKTPVADNMAEEFKKSHVDDNGQFDASAVAGMAMSMPEGTTLKPNESLHTGDGMMADKTAKHFPDGTKVYPDGTVQFANGAVMGSNVRDANGNVLPPNAMLHKDGTITNGSEIISPDGNKTRVGNTPVRLDDGTLVQGNGVRAIGEGENQVVIGSKGSITHGNSAVTKSGRFEHSSGAVTHGSITEHQNGNQSFSDGAVLLGDGKMMHLNGEVTSPDGTTVTPDGSTVFSDGSVLHSNGDVTSNGVTKHKDGCTTYSNRVDHGNAVISYNDGHVSFPGSTMVDGKGGISFDNGVTYQPIADLPGGQYVNPATGDIAYANGSVFHSESKAISNADGVAGRVNHADGGGDREGTFSLGGTVYWSNGTAVNPDRTIEFDEHNSGIVVKGRTITHSSGTRTEMKDSETRISRADGHTTFSKRDKGNAKFNNFGFRPKKKR